MSGTIQASVVKDSASATNNLTLDASGNVTVGNNLTTTGTTTLAGNPTTTGTYVMGSSFLRNRIINGDMRIDQRNAGATQTVTTSGSYTVDRFFVQPTGASVTTQRVSGTGQNQYTFRVTGAASVTACYVQQKIEQLNSYDLAGQSITISFTASSSTLTSMACYIDYATAGADNWSSFSSNNTNAITITSTPTRYSFTTTLSASATNGIRFIFNLGAFTSGTFDITGVQLEVGTVATPFERRQYGQELTLCQRYYEKSYAIGTVPGSVTAYSLGTTSGLNGYASAVYLFINVPFKVTKRTAATFAYWDAAGNASRTTYVTGGGLSQTDNNNNVSFATGSETGVLVSPVVTPSNNCLFNWTASAEL